MLLEFRPNTQTMDIKKGKVWTPVAYLNKVGSNNLYGGEIRLQEDEKQQTVVISLEIFRQSFNKDDFEELIDSIGILETIRLEDDYTYKKIGNFLNQKTSRLALRHQLELTLAGDLFTFDVKFRKSNSGRLEIRILR